MCRSLCCPVREISADFGEFQYDPLTQHNEIRVIRIQPGDEASPIRCTLTHQSIEAHTCLSYTWGKSKPKKRILLNGYSFYVRKNLWEFLSTARRYGVLEPLWIDAICINQNDNVEKGKQVQRMGDIYRHATSTIIWLGLRDDEVEALAYLVGVIESTTYLSDIPNPDSPFHDVRFIPCGWLDEDSSYRRARRRDDRDEKLLRLFKHFLFPNWSDFHSSFRRNPSFLDSAMITTDEKRLLLALSHPVIIKLHLADYWKRAWIVQEIGLSLELFILTPRRRIPFDNFLHRLLLLHFQHFQTLSHVLNFKLLNDIWVNHRYWFKHRPYSVFAGCYSDHKVDLLYALDFVRGRKCTDLRDRAYSILSLVKHGEDFPIDYSTKPTGLFWQLVRFIARHGVDGDFDGFEDRWVHGDILPGGSPKSLYVAATEDELDTGFDMRDLSLAAGMAFEILQLKTVFILGPNIHELSELTANFETLTSQYYWVRGPLPEEYKFSELGREITAERKMLWLCIPLRLAQKPALLMWTRDHLVTYNTKFGCKTGAGLYRKDSAWRVIETYHSPDYSFRGQFMR